ncbi:hypothetical protein [Nocardia sp. NPDC049707]|uniref:hypothetical protein n=1 Tax=Nocardia sp. NPDC049707 TaxID=3154735 RepID=UPI003445E668
MSASKVQSYLHRYPDTKAAITSPAQPARGSGDDLVDEHMALMIAALFEQITVEVSPETLSKDQAALYILVMPRSMGTRLTPVYCGRSSS